jgi:hypothetical protein
VTTDRKQRSSAGQRRPATVASADAATPVVVPQPAAPLPPDRPLAAAPAANAITELDAAGGTDSTAGTGKIAGTGKYASFNVLLDDPDTRPGLGFDGYASAISEIITQSRAEFAVGIFGRWGSGKTTLMRAIEKKLKNEHVENVVPVWFAAWRYEKEPNLILPLIDVLREALEARDSDPQGWARHAATLVGKAGQAFLAGLELSANLAGFSATIDPGAMIEKIKSGDKQSALSLYHAGFQMLNEAIEGLSAGGRRRVVVFIDDLDRCMPSNALDVLESMKVFFDVEGCVFVVGLDQDIAEKVVAVKYRRDGGMHMKIDGRDYLKKLFQVEFTLPNIGPHQLTGYLDTIERNSGFSEAQRGDFKRNVRRHLLRLQGRDEVPVNPREIKRLINRYTLQLKILSTRLRENVKPSVVLTLLVMNFRADWKGFYNQLAADPDYFQSTLKDVLGDDNWPESVTLSGLPYSLSREFISYLRDDFRPSILRIRDLAAYVWAAESTWSTDPWVLDARVVVGRLQRAGDELAKSEERLPSALREISGDVDRLYGLVGSRRESFGQLGAIRVRLQQAVSDLTATVRDLLARPELDHEMLKSRWNADAVPTIEAIDAELLAWHRYIGLGS